MIECPSCNYQNHTGIADCRCCGRKMQRQVKQNPTASSVYPVEYAIQRPLERPRMAIFDLDDTLFSTHVREKAARRAGLITGEPYPSKNRSYPQGVSKFLEFFDSPERFRSDPLIEGALDYVNGLTSQGYVIAYLTARRGKRTDETIQHLKSSGFPVFETDTREPLVFLMPKKQKSTTYKTNVIRKLQQHYEVQYFFDDQLANRQVGLREGIIGVYDLRDHLGTVRGNPIGETRYDLTHYDSNLDTTSAGSAISEEAQAAHYARQVAKDTPKKSVEMVRCMRCKREEFADALVEDSFCRKCAKELQALNNPVEVDPNKLREYFEQQPLPTLFIMPKTVRKSELIGPDLTPNLLTEYKAYGSPKGDLELFQTEYPKEMYMQYQILQRIHGKVEAVFMRETEHKWPVGKVAFRTPGTSFNGHSPFEDTYIEEIVIPIYPPGFGEEMRNPPVPKGYREAAGCLVQRASDNKILFLRRSKKETSKHGLYEFPGGKLEKGETPREAALIETKEEAGLDVKIIRQLPSHVDHTMKKVYHCFLAAPKKGARVKLSEEHDMHKWVSPNKKWPKTKLSHHARFMLNYLKETKSNPRIPLDGMEDKKVKQAKKKYKKFHGGKEPVDVHTESIDIGDVWYALGPCWSIGYMSPKETGDEEQKYIHHVNEDSKDGNFPMMYATVPEGGQPMIVIKGGSMKIGMRDGLAWLID